MTERRRHKDREATFAAARKLIGSGAPGEALELLDALRRDAPDDIDVAGAVASAHVAKGDLRRAAAVLCLGLRAHPANSLLLRNFGRVLRGLGDSETESRVLGWSLVLPDADATTWRDRGVALARTGHKEAAIAALSAALHLAPRDDIRKPLAQLLIDSGREREALDVLKQLETFDDATFAVFCNLASDFGADATLEAAYREWRDRLPACGPRADLAMAYVWRHRGKREAEVACLKAARQDNRLADQVGFELHSSTIAHGTEREIERSFAGRVGWRDGALPAGDDWACGMVTDIHSLDRQDGFNLSTDVIFAQYLRTLPTAGTKRRLHVDARIVSLMRRSFPALEVRAYPPGQQSLSLGPADLHVMELPVVALRRPEGWGQGAYLTADGAQRNTIRRRHVERHGNRPRVGLCWRSSRRGDADFRSDPRMLSANEMSFNAYLGAGPLFWRKCVALPFFRELIADPDLAVVSMQYGLADWEIDRMGRHPDYAALSVAAVEHFGELDAVASELAALDALVSIPCGYAHLAAALGVPTFVLLNDVPVVYWVWQQRFPFYPKVSCHAKPATWVDGDMVDRKYWGDWTATVRDAHVALRASLGFSTESGRMVERADGTAS